MAWEIPGFKYTLIAGVDMTAHQYKFVTIEAATGDAILASAGAAAVVAGVIQDTPLDQEPAEIMASGITKIVCGTGGLTVGEIVAVEAGGVAIDSTIGLVTVGIALTAAADTEIATILLYGPTSINPAP